LAEHVRARGPSGSAGWLESACKLIITIRAGTLLLTVVALPNADRRDLAAAAILCAAATSYIPLRYWDRVGPAIVRQPAYLAAELVLAALILVLTGVQSAFFYYTVGTALLGGLVYGWAGAAVFSGMLVAVYFWVIGVRPDDDLPSTFQTYVGLPALYPIVAAAGAGARRLLDAQAESENRLADQERRTAAQEERARLARDMHDSLAKTVHGIGFAALALAGRIARDPHAAAEDARRLAEDAKQAAHEARELLTDLRGGEHGEVSLAALVRQDAERWSSATAIPVQVALQDVGELSALARRELRWILKESLANAERHARAQSVWVSLRAFPGRVVLTVRDDGAGFDAPDDVDDLGAAGHYGLIGMRERARLAGGDLSVESEPGEGCVLSVWMPALPPDAPQPPVPPVAEPAPAPPSATVPDRSVTGFTWQ
jgi:signal transduction histidine kinase